MGQHGCVISISIVGKADSDSDKEPVFSVTMLALPRVMRWSTAMKDHGSDNFNTFLLASRDLGLKNQVIELRSDISRFA